MIPCVPPRHHSSSCVSFTLPLIPCVPPRPHSIMCLLHPTFDPCVPPRHHLISCVSTLPSLDPMSAPLTPFDPMCLLSPYLLIPCVSFILHPLDPMCLLHPTPIRSHVCPLDTIRPHVCSSLYLLFPCVPHDPIRAHVSPSPYLLIPCVPPRHHSTPYVSFTLPFIPRVPLDTIRLHVSPSSYLSSHVVVSAQNGCMTSVGPGAKLVA